MKLVLFLAIATGLHAETRMVERPSASPLVTIRIVFLTGAAAEPAAKAGVADLTASMLTQGGSREMSYKQIVDAMFPMATRVSEVVDKEMITFSAQTHADNLDAFYGLLRSMLLDPGWRADDFRRLKDQAINYLRVTLRGTNDEELAKEALYNILYQGTAYGRNNVGAVSALEKMTLDDVKEFYSTSLRRANVIIGLAGKYPPAFAARIRKDFSVDGSVRIVSPQSKDLPRNRVSIIEKDARAVAYSLGYGIDVKRGDRDYPALLLATAYLGQHRTAVGRLYQRMREARGLNYGDYAYIEYFPRGMFLFEPQPNLARRSQIFQIWIRPVEPATAGFALRLALYELDKLRRNGIPAEDFEDMRAFAIKYAGMLAKTKTAELGYAIDSLYYGIPSYDKYIESALSKLTRDEVNATIRLHLHTDPLQIVAISGNAQDLKQQLLAETAAPVPYNAPKPDEIVAEDEIVRKWKLGLRAEDITIVPAAQVFE